MTKLMIVDDHPLYREGVASVLAHCLPQAQVFAAATAEAGLALLAAHPDIELALIDIGMPGSDGFAALALYGKTFPGVARVLISGRCLDADMLERAMRAGASGFIPKTLSVVEMVAAIEDILAGGIYVPDLARHQLDISATESAEDHPPLPCAPISAGAAESLSIRQIEVLHLIGQGRANKEIARALDIAERTVKAHATRIFEALGAENRTQAVLAAQKLGLLPA